MLKIYDSIRDSDGGYISGLTKLIIHKTDDDGGIVDYTTGSRCVLEDSGALFVIDEWVIHQLDKLIYKNGKLSVKDGEELKPPVKSDLDLEEEEILRQLEDIKRRRAEKENEPAELLEYDEIINDDQRQSADK